MWSIQRGLKSQKKLIYLKFKIHFKERYHMQKHCLFFTSHFVTFWASSITNGKRHAKYTFTGLFYCTLSICICKLKKFISLKPVFIVCDCFHQTGDGGIKKPHIRRGSLSVYLLSLDPFSSIWALTQIHKSLVLINVDVILYGFIVGEIIMAVI